MDQASKREKATRACREFVVEKLEPCWIVPSDPRFIITEVDGLCIVANYLRTDKGYVEAMKNYRELNARTGAAWFWDDGEKIEQWKTGLELVGVELIDDVEVLRKKWPIHTKEIATDGVYLNLVEPFLSSPMSEWKYPRGYRFSPAEIQPAGNKQYTARKEKHVKRALAAFIGTRRLVVRSHARWRPGEKQAKASSFRIEFDDMGFLVDPSVKQVRLRALIIGSIVQKWTDERMRSRKSPSHTYLKPSALKFIEEHGGSATEKVYGDWLESIRPKDDRPWEEGTNYPKSHAWRKWWSDAKRGS